MRRSDDAAPAAGLFPDPVRVAVCVLDAGADADDLPAEERALVESAVAARRRAFAAGRRCARRLLAELGATCGPLLADAWRAPRWPDGYVGSISHGAGLCVVAVARAGPLLGLGVDVESDEPLSERLWPRICTEGERSRLLAPAGSDAGRLAKLVFSAKEALYKCAHPVVHEPLHWHDAEIEPEPGARRFSVRPLVPALERVARRGRISGAFVWHPGRVLSGVTLTADEG